VTTPLDLGQPFNPTLYLSTLGVLSDEENAIVARLQHKAFRLRYDMELTTAYYHAEQAITNLSIALPPELQGLRRVLGWTRLAVDPYVERTVVDGVRVAGENQVDKALAEILDLAGLDGELPLAVLDAFVKGRGWLIVGSSDDDDAGPVKITAESPLNIIAEYDTKTLVRNAWQTYWLDGTLWATLYKTGETVTLSMDDKGVWHPEARDTHGQRPPVHRLAYSAESNDRDGRSAIVPELRNIIDAAVRTLLNLDAAGEFYSVPQKAILGASESQFKKQDGTTASLWETYISRMVALKRDEDGQLPQVHQFQAYDPSVFTKVIEMYAAQAAGILRATPQDLGLYHDGNPVSAESMQVSESRRDRHARRVHKSWSRTIACVAQDAARYAGDGTLPKQYQRLHVDWVAPELLSFTGASDAVAKLTQVGHLAPGSDVALRRVGFSAHERSIIAEENKKNQALQFVTSVGSDVETRDLRAAAAVGNLTAAAQAQQANPSAANAVPGGNPAPAAQ
jgi:hypothetical protein